MEVMSPQHGLLRRLESTSSSNGNQKPQQQQMWDWEPTAAQTHHAADLHHQPPLFTASPVNSSPYSFPLMGIGSGGGYPFHSIVAEDYPAALIKNEDDRGVGQIGLNLGRRTYFPSGEAAAIEQLFRRSRGIYQVGQQATRCQAEGCKADLSVAKHYHRRHKVCELHSKATVVVAGGMQQRFCQQCSRFHPLSEFDEAKRSCRKRLAEHNRRRRKSQSSPTMSTAGSDRSNPTDSSVSSMDRSRLPSSNPTRNDAAAAKHLIPRPATSASTISGISQNNASLDNHKTAAHLWNGPSLSLGGGGSAAAVSEKGSGFGFLSHYSPQMPSWVFVSDDNNNTSGSQPSSSSSSSLFLHSPALFCNTPTEASQSVSTLAETNLLQLGQGLLEVDFI